MDFFLDKNVTLENDSEDLKFEDLEFKANNLQAWNCKASDSDYNRAISIIQKL